MTPANLQILVYSSLLATKTAIFLHMFSKVFSWEEILKLSLIMDTSVVTEIYVIVICGGGWIYCIAVSGG